ncbi:hypothetical protein ANO11243_051930 [Dothideomycetidae sp. 11243]|nr:hypothetical protein ANO11243_051930 [fungal sp. No.11243]
MDSNRYRSDIEPPTLAPLKPAKSPPLAFQMTSNDSLMAPRDFTQPSQLPFRSPDYLTSGSGGYGSDYEVSSPMELDLHGQVRKQTEALRLQHQAFVVERECWEMERDRLYRRIAALEALLKSPKGLRSVLTPPDNVVVDRHSQSDSPSKSPEMTPAMQGACLPPPIHRSSFGSNSSRLPSIAEHEASPDASPNRRGSFIQRDRAPRHIEIPADTLAAVITESGESTATLDSQDPPSPPATTQVLSPPPPEYRRNAGHTPMRLPSRPSSSHSQQGQGGLEDTPTRQNTAKNFALGKDLDEDPGLSGPLRLPELPTTPNAENFTFDALTARLQYIEEHPDENRPLALCAASNRDEDDDVDTSDHTIKPVEGAATTMEAKAAALVSQSQQSSAAELSPPPASEASQNYTPHDRLQDHGGIKLKPRTSMNFGAPFGQLRP